MPVRNGAGFLEEALDSVLAQSVRELELVVVDDGSTDDTPGLLAAAASREPRVRVLTREAAGLARAINAGIAAAAAPVVARMDADDVMLPGRLERQLALLDSRPDVGLVGGAYVLLGPRGERLATIRYPEDDAALRRALAERNCFAHPAVAFRRKLWEEVGGYRLANAEDYDLWLRMAEHTRLASIREPVLLYRQHASQFSVDALRRQAVGVAAVRAAARVRRATGRDPLDGAHELTGDVLTRAGLREGELEREIVGAYLRWGSTLRSPELLAAARRESSASAWRFALMRANARAKAFLRGRRPARRRR
jgi:glycosyltransferase involved in cell wall biosynthesis